MTIEANCANCGQPITRLTGWISATQIEKYCMEKACMNAAFLAAHKSVLRMIEESRMRI